MVRSRGNQYWRDDAVVARFVEVFQIETVIGHLIERR
jgi:hypothetical protein